MDAVVSRNLADPGCSYAWQLDRAVEVASKVVPPFGRTASNPGAEIEALRVG
jgi:hypothetical protein